MFYAVYPDGCKSADYYNYTRAKEHIWNLHRGLDLKCLPEPIRSSLVRLNDMPATTLPENI